MFDVVLKEKCIIIIFDVEMYAIKCRWYENQHK